MALAEDRAEHSVAQGASTSHQKLDSGAPRIARDIRSSVPRVAFVKEQAAAPNFSPTERKSM
jgi:hypothetical protein